MKCHCHSKILMSNYLIIEIKLLNISIYIINQLKQTFQKNSKVFEDYQRKIGELLETG